MSVDSYEFYHTSFGKAIDNALDVGNEIVKQPLAHVKKNKKQISKKVKKAKLLRRAKAGVKSKAKTKGKYKPKGKSKSKAKVKGKKKLKGYGFRAGGRNIGN